MTARLRRVISCEIVERQYPTFRGTVPRRLRQERSRIVTGSKRIVVPFSLGREVAIHEAGARERTVLNELESVPAAQVSLDSPAQREA